MSANSRLIQGRFRLKSFRGKKNLQHPLHGLDSLAGGLQELLQQLPSDSGRHFLDVSLAALRNWWSKCNITAPARRFYGGDEPLVRFWSFKSWDKSEVSWNLWIFLNVSDSHGSRWKLCFFMLSLKFPEAKWRVLQHASCPNSSLHVKSMLFGKTWAMCWSPKRF